MRSGVFFLILLGIRVGFKGAFCAVLLDKLGGMWYFMFSNTKYLEMQG